MINVDARAITLARWIILPGRNDQQERPEGERGPWHRGVPARRPDGDRGNLILPDRPDRRDVPPEQRLIRSPRG